MTDFLLVPEELPQPSSAGQKQRRRGDAQRATGEQPPPFPRNLWHYESLGRERGFCSIGGVDEVGRGPLAGPVVAACVILPADFPLDGIDDSKKLTESRRENAYARIVANATAIGIGSADPAEIDHINILRASWLAMRRAVQALSPRILPDLLLVDGLAVPDLPCPNTIPIVKGDSLSASIAAASIIAKVTRDRQMADYETQYPGFGFARHKGYGSADHVKALRALGPCPIHRRSFAPVSACLSLFDEP